MKKWMVFKLTFEGLITLFSMVLMFVHINLHIKNFYIISLIMCFLSFVLVFFLEIDKFKNYLQIKFFSFNMDFLITISIHITFLYSLILTIINISTNNLKNLNMYFWEVGFSLSFFIGIGHLIENKLKTKSSIGIKELLKLQNKKIILLQNKEFVEVDTNQLKINDIVLVNKGQSVPTDGILLSKFASLDYSSLLGESKPIFKNKNENILSGTINIGDSFLYKVTKTAKDSTLMKIIEKLENILINKTKIELISEKIVQIFLPIVLFLFIFSFIFWTIIGYLKIDIPYYLFENFDNPISLAINNSVSILVIACPCAFGIAVPCAIYSSSSIASKNKILFSSNKIYEIINKIEYVCFDKTGTLTNGKFEITKYNIINKKYENIIYNMCSKSNHPISKSISNFLAKTSKQINNSINFKSYKEIPGLGIFCDNKKNKYVLCSLKYVQNQNMKFSKNIIINEDTTTVFAINNTIQATFDIEDKIKPDSLKTIEKLKKMKLKTLILSGDKKNKVEKVAKALNVDYFFYELLPEEKLKILEKFKKKGGVVFVGDGINDILAIKSSTLGISYSSGSKITNSISDISLLENDLNLVLKCLMLVKKTIKLIKLNFLWASIFNILCIPLAFLGIIPPWLGAILMVSSTSFLLLNTLFFQNKNKKMIQNI